MKVWWQEHVHSETAEFDKEAFLKEHKVATRVSY